MTEHIWKLSPSDLTFLWDECPRCFYLKVVHRFNRPATAFPGIFSRIDSLMKGYFEGRTTAEFTPDLPSGVVRMGGKGVESIPLRLPGHAAVCTIAGRFDSVLEFEDGSYAVVDFKTTSPRLEHVAFYSRQLHAYAYALEHPAPGKLNLAPVTRMGQFSLDLDGLERHSEDRFALLGPVLWQECPRDEAGFMAFLEVVMGVLEQPELPPAGEKCGFCKYRDSSRATGY
jgi:hypothetical protein